MEKRTIDTLALDGGWLCLDFINTVHDRSVDEPFDYLSSYKNVLDWSVKVKLLSSVEKKGLENNANKNQERAAKIYSQFIRARETLYDFFLAIAQDKTPNHDTQDTFNSLLTEAMSQINIEIANKLDVQENWKDKTDLKYPLYPIMKSAFELLTSENFGRVKECGACGWLFFDQSKNKSRKWCSMETCGSNVKAKRYYHRKKKEESS